jgi:hypothetical protein
MLPSNFQVVSFIAVSRLLELLLSSPDVLFSCNAAGWQRRSLTWLALFEKMCSFAAASVWTRQLAA